MITPNHNRCVVCGSYATLLGSKCECGALYCSPVCKFSDEGHADICTTDFHMRIRKVLLLRDKLNLYGNLSRSIVARKLKGNEGSIVIFPNLERLQYGCLTYGKEIQQLGNFYWQIPKTTISHRSCSECHNSKLFICPNTFLPQNKCFQFVQKETIKIMMVLDYLNKNSYDILGDFVPKDITDSILEYYYRLNEDISRLADIEAGNHVCSRYFSVFVNGYG